MAEDGRRMTEDDGECRASAKSTELSGLRLIVSFEKVVAADVRLAADRPQG
jgi:hypothetical protein